MRQPPSASHRWRQLSSNVRQRNSTNLAFNQLSVSNHQLPIASKSPTVEVHNTHRLCRPQAGRADFIERPQAASGKGSRPRFGEQRLNCNHSYSVRRAASVGRITLLQAFRLGSKVNLSGLREPSRRGKLRSPPALPNPSLNRTGYGGQRKPGLWHIVHHHSPGLRCPPPPAG